MIAVVTSPSASMPAKKSPRLRSQRAPGSRRSATQKRMPPAPRRRMKREDRERQIVEEAVRYFSEVGFTGETRELARRLQITQPALFKYFATKDALIERVYQHVYVNRWNPKWQRLLTDRTLPLKQRMLAFYKDYARAILSPEWIRLFMFSGLKDAAINQRYLRLVRDRVFVPICIELRAHLQLPSVRQQPLTEVEIELVRALNEKIFYLGVRKWIYQTPVPDNALDIVEAEVEAFFEGVPRVVSDLIR
jgi:AcrR family transcriptional regulator